MLCRKTVSKLSRFVFISIGFVTTTALAQSIKISGTIKNELNGAPLAYASIEIKNSDYGVISDKDGEFTIKVDSKECTLKISYIGFHSRSLVFTESQDNVEILLQEKPINTQEVVVYAYSWVERFILTAIEKKERFREKLKHYQAQAYAKSKISMLKSGKSTIISLVEAISKISYGAPDFYQESLQSYKLPRFMKNFPYEFLSINHSIDVHTDLSRIKNIAITNPLHKKALDYYDFSINGQHFFDGDTLINIAVKPKKKRKALFEGSLLFNKRTHQLLEVNLFGNAAVSTGVMDSLVLHQKYALKDSMYNVPIFTKYELRTKQMGMMFTYSQTYVLKNYIINDEHAKPDIHSPILILTKLNKHQDLAVKRDSLFQMPLEKKDIAYLERIERELGKGAPLHIKLFLFYFLDVAPLTEDVSSGGLRTFRPSNWYHFNKVEGHFVGLEHSYASQDDFRMQNRIGYAFGQKEFNFATQLKYKNWTLDSGRETAVLGSIPHNRISQSFNALFKHIDDLHYYQESYAKIAFRFKFISPRVSLTPSLSITSQRPLKNGTDFSFSESTSSYSPNYQIAPYNKNLAGIALKYTENRDQWKEKTIIYEGQSFLNFEARYQRGEKRFLKTTEDRHIFDLDVQRYQSIFSAFSLDLKFHWRKQNHSYYIQEMNFLNRYTFFYPKQNALTLYTIGNLQFYVQNYYRLQGELTLFRLPRFMFFHIVVGGYFSWLEPLNKPRLADFSPLTKGLGEYGILLKGLGKLKLLIVRNSLANQQFRPKLIFEL